MADHSVTSTDQTVRARAIGLVATSSLMDRVQQKPLTLGHLRSLLADCDGLADDAKVQVHVEHSNLGQWPAADGLMVTESTPV